MNAAPLVLDSLTVARGDRVLFERLDLRIAPGEVLHLQGRNGAGKTSLLEVLAGLRTPEAGRFSGPEPEQLHWIGHKNALHPALSAVENLAAWCGLHGADTAGIPAALDRLQLKAARQRPVRTLSTGQKRRSALARLLLQRRPWWLLDEPLAGLDVEGAALLAGLLAEHCAAGGGAVVTSHQALPEEHLPVRHWSLR
ncbi:heme ABC exporter ATP-binding protein CcmA [Stagnimonas aquatica]|uniref:Heme ABC exporter ATP-binding protein CcmA n=1 Tax=Stagnimonas aquatica TaxID=2689987 RepID=A0A3N0V9U8_9GAMM|nr:heme ABC exporter ATP-binding protein CcmA [Stagnimonas aquatica]ROH89384.1 heme ABC exporter ATP-binding protein CcmA [Stagnimonas aquatica]